VAGDEDEDEDAYDCECDLAEIAAARLQTLGCGTTEQRAMGLSPGREQYEIQCHICCMN